VSRQVPVVTFDATQSPPVPEISELTKFYWDAVAEHRLELLRCQSCGHYLHFPRPLCERCHSMDVRPEQVSGRGTLYSYSVIMQASHPYFSDKVPYVIGVIDLEEEPGVRIPTGIAEASEEQLRCGMPMEVVFREITPTLTLPYFRPA
jgi:uncharacterized OB-fold protein